MTYHSCLVKINLVKIITILKLGACLDGCGLNMLTSEKFDNFDHYSTLLKNYFGTDGW
jgi:hypothetical protein